MTTYLARVRHDGSIHIHRNDQPEPVAAVTLPTDGTSLRRVLRQAGWQPTGAAAGARSTSNPSPGSHPHATALMRTLRQLVIAGHHAGGGHGIQPGERRRPAAHRPRRSRHRWMSAHGDSVSDSAR